MTEKKQCLVSLERVNVSALQGTLYGTDVENV